MGEIRKFYEENQQFKNYVDRGMNQRWKGRSLEEVLQMSLVKEVAKAYKDERCTVIPVQSTYTPSGCCR